MVSTHSIRYRILKGGYSVKLTAGSTRFNPFDPIQDTESICKVDTDSLSHCFNPFDPIQDTESTFLIQKEPIFFKFQPIRSDTGY